MSPANRNARSNSKNNNNTNFYEVLQERASYFNEHGDDVPEVYSQDTFDDGGDGAQGDFLDSYDSPIPNNHSSHLYNPPQETYHNQDGEAQDDPIHPTLWSNAPPNLSQRDTQRAPLNAHASNGTLQSHVAYNGPVQGGTQPVQASNAQKKTKVVGGKSKQAGKKPNKKEGRLRNSPNGNWLECPDPANGANWVPAIHHSRIRGNLLQEASHLAARYGDYDFPPARGHDANDQTAFVPGHKSWGPDRPNRPEINFVFDAPANLLPAHIQPNSQPINWIWQGYVVLDHNNWPMKHFNDCPTTLASCVEGFRLDAILKRNPRIEINDLWARLPLEHTVVKASGERKSVDIVTIPGLTNVAMRWRYRACVLSWSRRAGSDDTRRFLKHFLTAEQFRNNSTRGREDLTKHEVNQLETYKRSAELARNRKQPVPNPLATIHDAAPSPIAAAPAVQPLSPGAESSGLNGGVISFDDWSQHQEANNPNWRDEEDFDFGQPSDWLDDGEVPIHQEPSPILDQLLDGSYAREDHSHSPEELEKADPSHADLYGPQAYTINKPKRSFAEMVGTEDYEQDSTQAQYHNQGHDSLDKFRSGDQVMSGIRPIRQLKRTLQANGQAPSETYTDGIDSVTQMRSHRQRHHPKQQFMKPKLSDTGIPMGSAGKKRRLEHSPAGPSAQDETQIPTWQQGVSSLRNNHDQGFSSPDHEVAEGFQQDTDEEEPLSPQCSKQDASAGNWKTVPAGHRHLILPTNEAITFFCPDDTRIKNGVITAKSETLWHEPSISDTIGALKEMDPKPEELCSKPEEIFPENEAPGEQASSAEPYQQWVSEGLEAFCMPIGTKVICVWPAANTIMGGVISADGQNDWHELSIAATTQLLRGMELRLQKLQSADIEPLNEGERRVKQGGSAASMPADGLGDGHTIAQQNDPHRFSPEPDPSVPTKTATAPPDQASSTYLSPGELMLKFAQENAEIEASKNAQLPQAGNNLVPAPASHQGLDPFPSFARTATDEILDKFFGEMG